MIFKLAELLYHSNLPTSVHLGVALPLCSWSASFYLNDSPLLFQTLHSPYKILRPQTQLFMAVTFKFRKTETKLCYLLATEEIRNLKGRKFTFENTRDQLVL